MYEQDVENDEDRRSGKGRAAGQASKSDVTYKWRQIN